MAVNPATVYNASVAAGVVCASVGAGAQWGWPVGLMVAGGLVLVLSFAATRVG